MGGRGNYIRISLILFSLVFIALEFQNCTGGNKLSFEKQRESLSSSMAEGGGGSFDGKPKEGYYCRVFDDIKCQTQVDDLQGLMKVDNSGLHLVQDNCASTSTNFLLTDAAVGFSTLAPNYIGVTRGIFKKCEVGANNLPIPPTEMTDAICTSSQYNVAVVLNKNTSSSKFDFTFSFRDPSGVRSATGNAVTKTIGAPGSSYSSETQEFNLKIARSDSQTASGELHIVVDNRPWNLNLTCRQASPDPTVIIEKDMEFSPTWINTSRLAGYWKLNEVNAGEGTSVIDSSRFAAHGVLATNNDGQNKSDASVDGGALLFDGTNDFVDIASSVDGHLDFGMGSFTYMVWIRKSGNASAFDMPLWHGGHSDNNAGYDIECGSAASGCKAIICDGQNLPTSQQSVVFAGGPSLVGRWVLLTAVVDRGNQQMRAYLDGVLVDTSNISNVGSLTTTRGFRLGSGLNFDFFLGSIDDVSIWNGVLSNAEITEIFQRLRPKFY